MNAKIVFKDSFRIFRRTRLRNRYVQVDEEVLDSLNRAVETDVTPNRCKVHD